MPFPRKIFTLVPCVLALALTPYSFADSTCANVGTPVNGLVKITCNFFYNQPTTHFDLFPLMTQNGASLAANDFVTGYTVVINGDPATLADNAAGLFNTSLWEAVLFKEPNDPTYANDPKIQEVVEFMKKYVPDVNPHSRNAAHHRIRFAPRRARWQHNRRASVARSASGASVSPFFSSAARMKRSIIVRTRSVCFTSGGARRTGGTNAQCSRYSAPSATQRRKSSFCSAVKGLWSSTGGIRSSSSCVVRRRTNSLCSGCPGTIEADLLSPPFISQSKLSRRK